jgi:hypothetical protein
MLAQRLTRQGVSLAVLLAQNQGTASASVPTPLLSSTVKAASLFAVGRAATVGVVSSEVVALAREVLKTMLFSKIKITTAALLVLTLAGAGLWQARTWADGRAPADASFRVTVNEVIHDETTVVTQIGIEAPPRSVVELFSDDKRVNSISSADLPNRPNGMSEMQVILFADHVELKEGLANAVKFMLAYKVGKISSSTSDTAPMPADAKKLADLLTVPIKSGEYKCGLATKMVTFKGVTYSLVVNRPK